MGHERRVRTLNAERSQRNIGTVVSVRESVVDVRFPDRIPGLLHRLEAGDDGRVVIEVAAHLSADLVRGIALTSASGLARGSRVVDVGHTLDVPVGRQLLGRMFNVFGETIDHGEDLVGLGRRSIHQATVPLMELSTHPEILETGIKAIDVLTPIERGGKTGLFLTDFPGISASIVLSRKRASQGFYPAIEALGSDSKMLMASIAGERHYGLALAVRETMATYEEVKDLIAMLGIEELSVQDRKLVNRARRLERFLTQPFFTTEQFTGKPGRHVKLVDALDGCERILNDEFADVPEAALYMIGDITEVAR